MNLGPFTITVHHRMRYVRDLGHVARCLIAHGLREDAAWYVASIAYLVITDAPSGEKIDLTKSSALHYKTMTGKQRQVVLGGQR